MYRFVLRRLLSGVVLLFVITTVAYLLLYAGGGDIARRIVGPTASQAQVTLKAAQLGLDRPLLAQYWDWLTHALTGDLGRSWFNGQLVTTGVTSRVSRHPLPGDRRDHHRRHRLRGPRRLGRQSARGWVDRVVQFVFVLGFAIPGFLIALGLVSLFAINLKWFKATGYIPFTTSFGGWAATVTLPIIALVHRLHRRRGPAGARLR